jgi:hypothetical protein
VEASTGLLKYDPDQPRDRRGRWTETGNLIDPAEVRPVAEVLKDRAMSNWRAEPGGNFTEQDWDVVQGSSYARETKLSWTGSAFSFDVNRYLRGERLMADGPARRAGVSDEELDLFVARMDTAFEHAGEIGAPVKVYRGLVGPPEKLGIREGETITDLGYGASSTNQLLVMNHANTLARSRRAYGETFVWPVLMNLRVSPEVKAIWGANTQEDELIMERGLRYRIISVTEHRGENGDPWWQVDAEVLPPE